MSNHCNNPRLSVINILLPFSLNLQAVLYLFDDVSPLQVLACCRVHQHSASCLVSVFINLINSDSPSVYSASNYMYSHQRLIYFKQVSRSIRLYIPLCVYSNSQYSSSWSNRRRSTFLSISKLSFKFLFINICIYFLCLRLCCFTTSTKIFVLCKLITFCNQIHFSCPASAMFFQKKYLR